MEPSPPVHSKKGWVVSTQIWVKYGQTQMQLKNVQLKVKVNFEITFLTQHLGLSIFDPNLS